MEEIIFLFKGEQFSIKCGKGQLMKDICEKFALEAGVNKECNYFVYLQGKLNKKLTINEQVESLHKENNNKINILVYEKEKEDSSKLKIQNNIICPKCGENCRIALNNFKITLYDCKNSHKINDILLDEFKNTQIINEKKLVCQNCEGFSKNNELYYCLTCKGKFCHLCKWTHDINHKIIDYNKKYIICGEHEENCSLYCNNCKYNLCHRCKEEHEGHEIIDYKDIMFSKERIKELIEKRDYLKKKIDEVDIKIKNIIKIFNKTMKNLEIYYNIYNDILNNYKNQYLDFKNIQNVIGLKDNFNSNDLDKIIEEKNITNQMINIFNLYNNITNKKDNLYKDNEDLINENSNNGK